MAGVFVGVLWRECLSGEGLALGIGAAEGGLAILAAVDGGAEAVGLLFARERFF